jgi:predicted negative regulator of RcsB-dependent stress response|tara:strand:- start:140 stop:763 length:624 start_codon:yes stop_codon:yes gene_type:complete
MNFLNKIYAWILKNYIKVISFLLIIGLAYGAYLYYFFQAQKKDQDAGDLFLSFYNSYSVSDFDEEEYKIAIDAISQIDDASIYLAMLKSINAAESVKVNDLQKALAELLNAKEILSSKSNNFNFLKEIIDLRMVNIFIDLEDLERAKKILSNNFTTYQTNKLILQGDIFATEKKFKDAKKKYVDALARSENETQRNLINLKISTLTE